MNETAVSQAADGSLRGAPGQQGERPSWLTPTSAAITVATVLALALRVYYQSTRLGFLLGVNEYDDGPYFGSAVRLVNGMLPYRGFIFVQPPGITLLMTPAALVAKLTGTAWGLAAGRILTVFAGTASVVLGGLLVRHRGVPAVVVTCGLLAVYPDAIAAAHTILVEPWLVLFCLAGVLAVFDGDRLAGGRRLAWGGVAFGFGGAVEPWAIVPVVVIFALCLPQVRRAALFTAGVTAGFCVPVLPFAAAGPRQFYQSLIVAQIGPRVSPARTPVWSRLSEMIGITHPPAAERTAVLVAAGVVVFLILAAIVAAAVLTRRLPPPLEEFAAATTCLMAVIFCAANQFYYHFVAFLAPFLAVAIALPASRLLAAIPTATGWHWARRGVQRSAVGLASLAIGVAAVLNMQAQGGISHVIGRVPARLDRIIPPGACVLTDQVTITILANRFVSDVPGCSQIVDGLATDLALSHGRKPSNGAGSVPAVAAVWRAAFDHAQYVLLSVNNAGRIAWSPALQGYFRSHFARIPLRWKRVALYARDGLRPR